MDEDNLDLQTYVQEIEELRRERKPSTPSLLDRELMCNPFMRCNQKSIAEFLGLPGVDSSELFQALRYAKDCFVG